MKRTLLILIIIILLCPFSTVLGQELGARYLAITADIFYEDAKPLVEWKHRKGMRARLVKLSETGSSAVEIRDYIRNAYATWTIRPEYILFVGAPNYIPMTYHNGAYTDNYYTDINDDLFNEVLSGRLTVHSNDETKNVVNKILHYERWPDTTDRTWFTKATLIANTDGEWHSDSIYWDDIHHFAGLMADTGFTHIDTLSDQYGNSSADVINGVNDGRGFVLYRGSGVSNWWPPFDCDPDQVQNGYQMPVVLSITCSTLGSGSTPAAAERWFLTGTASEPKGAAGYFATTTVLTNGAHFRSAIAQGFADALFLEDCQTFGKACEGGRKRVWMVWGNANEYRGYHTIGDPEMNLWLCPPRHTAVDHPSVVMLGLNEMDVTVTANSVPCAGATVCLIQCDTVIYEVATTGADGRTHLTFNVLLSDSMTITVTGPGLYPYEGRIMVSFSGSYVAYLRHDIVDSVTGNGNHRLNPGETASLPVWIKNYGVDTAVSITAVLQPVDTAVAVIDSTAAYPDLIPGDTALGTPPFLIRAIPGAIDGQQLMLRLICRSSNDTAFSQFPVRVCAPDLDIIHDSILGGNGNGVLDPGEMAGLMVTLMNQGQEIADSVRAVLRCASPYLTIIDSLAAYGNMLPDSTANNAADLFTLSADAQTPIGIMIDVVLNVSAPGYRDSLTLRLIVGKKQYLIWNPDYSPEPGQAMHAALAALGYSGDYTITLPADLSYYQAVFVCVGVFPNNYMIGSGSQEASTLVNFVNGGGRAYLEGGDVWCWDPSAGGYDFCPLFSVIPCNDGGNNMGPVAGDSGTFTRGMYFEYGGENQWMDQITAAGGSSVIFRDPGDGFDCGVCYDAGSYRTVGMSFELGGLIDAGGVSTRSVLLDSIIRFFGMTHGIAENVIQTNQTWGSLSVYPNPFRNRLMINVQSATQYGGPMTNDQTTSKSRISINVYDITGRLVKSLSVPQSPNPNSYALSWQGQDDEGRSVPQGIYFIRAVIPGYTATRKVILVR